MTAKKASKTREPLAPPAEKNVEETTPDKPTHEPLNESRLGEELRIRRFQPEQRIAQTRHFEKAGIDPAAVAVDSKTKEPLCRLLQRCIVDKSDKLFFPGGKGLKRLEALADSVVERVAKTVIQFQESAQ